MTGNNAYHYALTGGGVGMLNTILVSEKERGG